MHRSEGAQPAVETSEADRTELFSRDASSIAPFAVELDGHRALSQLAETHIIAPSRPGSQTGWLLAAAGAIAALSLVSAVAFRVPPPPHALAQPHTRRVLGAHEAMMIPVLTAPAKDLIDLDDDASSTVPVSALPAHRATSTATRRPRRRRRLVSDDAELAGRPPPRSFFGEGSPRRRRSSPRRARHRLAAVRHAHDQDSLAARTSRHGRMRGDDRSLTCPQTLRLPLSSLPRYSAPSWARPPRICRSTSSAARSVFATSRLASTITWTPTSLRSRASTRSTPSGKVSQGSRDRFATFLVEWLGGPTVYSPVHGHPRLRMRHAKLPVDIAMRDAWLRCMTRALDDLSVSGDVRTFLDARFAEVADFLRNVHPTD